MMSRCSHSDSACVQITPPGRTALAMDSKKGRSKSWAAGPGGWGEEGEEEEEEEDWRCCWIRKSVEGWEIGNWGCNNERWRRVGGMGVYVALYCKADVVHKLEKEREAER